jgi:hypothetical protein
MKLLAASLAAIAVLSGCASRPDTSTTMIPATPTTTTTVVTPGTTTTTVVAPAPPATPQTFRGEVWTWDEHTNTVTLRQTGGATVRVRVRPEDMRTLRLYETTTIRGTIDPPAEIASVTTPPPVLVPRGSADSAEATGTVGAVTPGGLIAVSTPRGPAQVWVTTSTGFRVGEPVRLRMQVQPLEAVSAGSTTTPPATAAIQPSASPSTEPGDYAVVIGRILSVDPAGRLTVESPRGPVEVWVPVSTRYRIGQSVEVRTSVHPAR